MKGSIEVSPAYKRVSELDSEQLAKFKDLLNRMAENSNSIDLYQELLEAEYATRRALNEEHAEFMKTIEIEGT